MPPVSATGRVRVKVKVTKYEEVGVCFPVYNEILLKKAQGVSF
jgi:hypothetical protein